MFQQWISCSTWVRQLPQWILFLALIGLGELLEGSKKGVLIFRQSACLIKWWCRKKSPKNISYLLSRSWTNNFAALSPSEQIFFGGGAKEQRWEKLGKCNVMKSPLSKYTTFSSFFLTKKISITFIFTMQRTIPDKPSLRLNRHYYGTQSSLMKEIFL